MNEDWKYIKGTERNYLVSSKGRIMSLKHKAKPWFLKFGNNKQGYEVVTLMYPNYVSKNKLVHRLVAEAFLFNDNNLPMVNHKDMNPVNNNLENLEWCDNKYNLNHAKNIKGNWQARGEKSGKTKLNNKQVKEIVQMLSDRTDKEISEQFEVSVSNINGIRNGKSWSWLTGIDAK